MLPPYTGAVFPAVLPLALTSLLALSAAALWTRRETVEVHFREQVRLDRAGLRLWAGLFACCLLSVFRVLHYGLLAAAVLLCMAAFAPRLLPKVDYSLLLTFACFFVFAGNLGRIAPVREALTALLSQSTLISSALASQVISNVPAAVLLSGFTGDWRGLLMGVNVGGLGTPIASLASLISLRLYLRAEGARALPFLAAFTLANLAGLALLLPLAARLL